MRTKLNLDQTDLSYLSILVHGGYGFGKTHLLGDFLRFWQVKGDVRFLNIAGEDGHLALTGMGLGEIGETVETFQDYQEALRDIAKAKPIALGVESLPVLHKMVLREFFGEVRYPDPKLDGERARMLWGQIKMKMFHAVMDSRRVAPYVLWTAAYDRSEDPMRPGHKEITPDLPGQLAMGCAGWFDLVANLQVEVLVGKIKRSLVMAPSDTVLTKVRLPVTAAIPLPEGAGGWEAIWNTLQQAHQRLVMSKGQG